jgi:hypothetical protein
MLYGLRSGNLEALSRYWIAVVPYLCLVGGSFFSLKLIQERRIFREISRGTIGLLCLATALGIFQFWEKRDTFQPGEKDFIHWLSSNRSKGVVFDFMDTRDGRYIIYSSEVGKRPLAWGRGSSNPFGLKLKKSAKSNTVESASADDFFAAHASLFSPNCEYLVFPSEQVFSEKIECAPSPNRRKPLSYFKPDMEDLGSGQIRIKSSVLPSGRELVLTRVFSNAAVQVYAKKS